MFNRYFNFLLIAVLIISIVPFFMSFNPADTFIEEQNALYLKENNDPDNIFSRMGFSETSTMSMSFGLLILIIPITLIFIVLAISFYKNLKTQKILVLLGIICFCSIMLIKMISAIFPLTYIKSKFNGAEILNGFYRIPISISDSIYFLGFILLLFVFRGISKDLRILNTSNRLR